MKSIIRLLPAIIVAITILTSCNSKPAEEVATTTPEPTGSAANYSITADSSSFVNWKGVMLGVKEHTGKVFFKEGSISTIGTSLTGGSFTVDLTNIVATDTFYNEKAGFGKAKLISHLSSPDFFDVANFPTASFKIDSVTGNSATGVFTVRGKSNVEKLTDISIVETETGVTATGNLKFDRKKYDVKFDMPMKDMVISNDIELRVELVAKK